MAINLDKVDAVPVLNSKFEYTFDQWLSVLVDTLNEVIIDIENLLVSQQVVTLATQLVTPNSLYIPTNALQTVFTLPALCKQGNRVTIAGFGAGGWNLLTGVGQTIQIRDIGAVANTSVSSSNRYDSIELICVEDNKTWITLSTQTTGFVIV
jgi:hypothetical protein